MTVLSKQPMRFNIASPSEQFYALYSFVFQLSRSFGYFISKSLSADISDSSLELLAEQAENIKQDRFLLMVVGEAKSGKSTFINAYLGEEIL